MSASAVEFVIITHHFITRALTHTPIIIDLYGRGLGRRAAAVGVRILMDLDRDGGLGFAGLHGEQGCACGDWMAKSDI